MIILSKLADYGVIVATHLAAYPDRQVTAGTVAIETRLPQATVAKVLKALAHEARLMILCDLLRGEKSVGELEALLSRRQSTVSQQLARLRLEGLVSARRDGKTIYYSIASDRARSIIGALYASFCAPDGP